MKIEIKVEATNEELRDIKNKNEKLMMFSDRTEQNILAVLLRLSESIEDIDNNKLIESLEDNNIFVSVETRRS